MDNKLRGVIDALTEAFVRTSRRQQRQRQRLESALDNKLRGVIDALTESVRGGNQDANSGNASALRVRLGQQAAWCDRCPLTESVR